MLWFKHLILVDRTDSELQLWTKLQLGENLNCDKVWLCVQWNKHSEKFGYNCSMDPLIFGLKTDFKTDCDSDLTLDVSHWAI